MKHTLKGRATRLISFLLILGMMINLIPGLETTAFAMQAKILISLNIPMVNDANVASFPNATIETNEHISSMTVCVDKGSIKSTDFTLADNLSTHKTAMWKFETGTSRETVLNKLRSIEFNYVEGMKVTVQVDANQNEMPDEAKITTGSNGYSDHYYMYVESNHISWLDAYNQAKTYTYQGKKGYLATILTKDEGICLKNIYSNYAWCAATSLVKEDGTKYDDDNSISGMKIITTIHDPSSLYNYYYWACGPETGQIVPSDVWASGEPNNFGTGEQCAITNWLGKPDLNDEVYNYSLCDGFFVEFGGYPEGTDPGGTNKALIANALGLPQTSQAAANFIDVENDSDYFNEIGAAYEYGIAKGISATHFAPKRTITREEAMVMLQRAAKLIKLTGQDGNINIFIDAKEISDWAREAVAFDVGNGLIVGANNQINPKHTITRAESMTAVLRMLQKAKLIDIRTNV